jgi:lipoic acid synthetase
MSDTAYDPTEKQKGSLKTARIPIKVVQAETLRKPDWIRVRAARHDSRFGEIKQILRDSGLHTVCEEASCPNIGECFGGGTATFMIMATSAPVAAPSATSATAGPTRWTPASRKSWRKPSPR